MKAFLIAACAVVAVLCAAPPSDAGVFRKGLAARRESRTPLVLPRRGCVGGVCR